MLLLVKDGEARRDELAGRFGFADSDAAEPVESREEGFTLDTLPIAFLPDGAAEANDAFAGKLAAFGEYLSEGERIVSHRFGVMAEGHEEFHRNCPAIKVTSTVTEYVVIYNEHLYEDGVFRECDIPYGNYRPRPDAGKIRLRNPAAMLLATAFARALGKVAAKHLYSSLFPKQKESELLAALGKLKADLGEMVEELLEVSRYKSLEGMLIGTRTWLIDTYSTRLLLIEENKLQSPASEVLELKQLRDQLRADQEAMQRVVGALFHALPDAALEECDYVTRTKVMLYAACACLRVILFKELIYVQTLLVERGLAEYDPTADRAELQKFVPKAADKIDEYVGKLYEGRLRKISEVEHFNNLTSSHSWWSFWAVRYSGEAGYQWRDDFESKNPHDPFHTARMHQKYLTAVDNTAYEREPIRQAVKQDREKRIEEVKRLLEEHVSSPFNAIAQTMRDAQLEIVP